MILTKAQFAGVTIDQYGNVTRDGKIVNPLPRQDYPSNGLFAAFKNPPDLVTVNPMHMANAPDFTEDMVAVAYDHEGIWNATLGWLGLMDTPAYALFMPAGVDFSGHPTSWHVLVVNDNGSVNMRVTTPQAQDIQSTFDGIVAEWQGLPQWFRSSWAANFGGQTSVFPVVSAISNIGANVGRSISAASTLLDFITKVWPYAAVAGLLGAGAYVAGRVRAAWR